MAPTPTIADAGALVVTPARVNIFAKSSARQDQIDPAAARPRGVFDDAAACHSTDEVSDRPTATSGHGGIPLGGAGPVRRLAFHLGAAAAVTGLIVAISLHPRNHGAAQAPAAPAVHQQRQRHAPHEANRQPRRPRVAKQRSQRKQRNAHRVARSTGATRRARRLPRRAPAASVPRLAPPHPGAHVAVPARPLPTRVAPGAPPEFM
jgi:hypothetical protein